MIENRFTNLCDTNGNKKKRGSIRIMVISNVITSLINIVSDSSLLCNCSYNPYRYDKVSPINDNIHPGICVCEN